MQGNIRTSLLKDGFSLSELSVGPKRTVQYIRLKGVVLKDLGVDIWKVVGSNPCVVNHRFISGLLALTKAKTIFKKVIN